MYIFKNVWYQIVKNCYLADILGNAKLPSSAALFDLLFSTEVKKHQLNFTESKSSYPEYNSIKIVNRISC